MSSDQFDLPARPGSADRAGVGSAARTVGVLAATAGRPRQAACRVARAVQVNERSGALCQPARARHDYGLLLLGDLARPDEATEHLASARTIAERLRMRGLLEAVPSSP